MQKNTPTNLVINRPVFHGCGTRTDADGQWFAHSGKLEDLSDWQPLKEHLTAVANLAAHRAKAFGAEDWAFLIGLLHDLGKYTQEFQARLHGDPARADHATAGAKVVMQHFVGLYGDSPQVKACAKLLAFVIAGHHAGLANGEDEGQERSTLKQRLANEEGAYHLTTAMCAEHRSQKLKEIRQRLQNGQACRLVATSLIEAGVDVDFPTVYRAEAGLDSIAQAAGRCNREGRRLLADSQVFIFQSNKWKAPPELAQLAAPMRSILRTYEGDVLAPEALKNYFQQVYYTKGADLDHHQILKKIRITEACDFPFQDIARDFQMIDNNMLPIIVPFDEVAEENLKLLRHLPENMSVSTPTKKLQRYMVQVPEKAFVQLLKLGAIEAVAPEKFGNQFYELVAPSLYCRVAGLNLTDLSATRNDSHRRLAAGLS